jgi:hypothetical protein
VFPQDWTELILHQKAVVSKSLKFMSAIVMESFTKSDNAIHIQIWHRLFHTCFDLVNQPMPHLDKYPMNKRSTLQLKYESIIRQEVSIICDMWEALGDQKYKFVQQFVGPVLTMSMQNDSVIRRKSILMFGDMIECIVKGGSPSQTDEEKLREVASTAFNEFDFLIESNRGDFSYKNDFKEIMQEADANRNVVVRNLVAQLNLFLEQLLQYYFYKKQSGKENLIRSIAQLIHLTSGIKHFGLYLRLVYRLYDIHMSFYNYAEAAMTLKLHSDLLDWNSVSIMPMIR